MATVTRWTGVETKALRMALRLTVYGFAEHLGVDSRTVNKWEARGRDITLRPDTQDMLDSALRRADQEVHTRFEQTVNHRTAGLDREAVGADPSRVTDLPGLLCALAAALPAEAGLTTHQLSECLRKWATDVNRRELIRMLGLAATNVAAPALLTTALDPDERHRVTRVRGEPARVDEHTVDQIERVLHVAQTQDDVLGPQVTLDTALAQRTFTSTLLAECPSTLRPRLLTLHSKLSRFAGWLSFDLADYPSAEHYYEQARQSAHEAQDTDLSALVLCGMSYLATWQKQPRTGIDHAIAAQNWVKDSTDPQLHAWVNSIAARAYAGARDDGACRRALDDAEAAIAAVTISQTKDQQTPATSMAYFCGPGLVASDRSQCARQLGWTEAERAARRALELTGDAFVRLRAFSTIELGRAILAAGDVDEAARTFGTAATLTARNRSIRLQNTLTKARNSLRPWPTRPTVRELDDKLAAYRLSPNAII